MADTRWQPISTAPKDGSLIDVWLEESNTELSGRETEALWDDKYGWCTNNSDDGLEWSKGLAWAKVTHWMPLPEPPSREK